MELIASKTLQKLAEHPFDLTQEGNLTAERLEKFCAEGCGFKFMYGTERVTEEVMDALIALASEVNAIDKMRKMQQGEVLNYIEGYPSEERPVLHTATRDFFDAPQAPQATELAKKEVDKLKAFMQKIDSEQRFTDLIMVAIGGSDLGPQANYLALQHLQKSGRNVHFISNIDPDHAAMVLHNLDLSKSLVVVVSKSGTTLETVTNEELVREHFRKQGLRPEEHFLAVTGKGSPMDDKSRYLECFHIWDWVGGRFSTSSMVGGVVLSFGLGFENYWEFLKGAHAMDQNALEPSIDTNLSLLAALLSVWNHNYLQYPTLALVPYSQVLYRYAAHVQQVEMESNGKQIDRLGRMVPFQTGPIVWGEPGTNAQHSFFQLIHQGTATIPMEFIGFKESAYAQDIEFKGTTSHEKLLSNLFAQAIALATGQKSDNPNKAFPGNRPSHILFGKKPTAFALGALLSFFEHKVAFQGFVWNINSFDQEGVQLGKVLATRVLDRFAAQRGNGEHHEYPLGDAFLKHLNTL